MLLILNSAHAVKVDLQLCALRTKEQIKVSEARKERVGCV